MLGIVVGLIALLALTLVIKRYRGNNVNKTQSIIINLHKSVKWFTQKFIFCLCVQQNQKEIKKALKRMRKCKA